MEPTVQQKIALINEIQRAHDLVVHGLAALQAIGGANDFYDLPFLLLASGLERLCKCILIIDHLHKTESLPPHEKIRTYVHALDKLVDDVKSQSFVGEYLKRPIAREDLDFLSNDRVLAQIVEYLRDFAKGGRYYDLDAILAKPQGDMSPQEKWKEMELDVIMADPSLKELLTRPGPKDELHEQVNTHFVVILERLVRALTRTFTLGPASGTAREYHGQFYKFIVLEDSELGRTKYESLKPQ